MTIKDWPTASPKAFVKATDIYPSYKSQPRPTYDSAEGQAYRARARERPSGVMTPRPAELQNPPQTNHGGPARHHVETVGYPGDGAPFQHPTFPNAKAMRGTDAFLDKTGKHTTAPLGHLNTSRDRNR